MKTTMQITVDQEIKEAFRDMCKQRGMKASTRIQLLIKKDIENYDQKFTKDIDKLT